jgi:hypothetical protein
MLKVPSSYDGYIVYYYVSRMRIGCVLMQHDMVIAYASRQLRKHEQKYLVYGLEMTTIIFSLKI